MATTPRLIPRGAQWTPAIAAVVIALFLVRQAWVRQPRWLSNWVLPNTVN